MGRRIFWSFATLALVYNFFGLLGSIVAQQEAIVLSSSSQIGDTYYVVSTANPYVELSAMFAIIAGAVYIPERFGQLLYPTVFRYLFWIWHSAIIVALVAAPLIMRTFGMPRRYVDYEAAFKTYNLISTWAAFFAFAAFIGLLVLVIGSLVGLAWTRDR